MDPDDPNTEPKHLDEQIADETAPQGSMSEEVVEDTAKEAQKVGIHAKNDPPDELHIAQDIEVNKKEQ